MGKIFDVDNIGASFSALDTGPAYSDTDEDSIIDLAKQVIHYFQSAQETIQKGDWIEYGRYNERLKEAVQDLNAAIELEEE